MKPHLQKLWQKILANKWEILLVIGLLTVAGLAHGWNMFHYPYYENDEATYVSQAWSIITQGKLAPYTYWYDHAPGGWIFLGFWFVITNGVHMFGSLLDSGRVLMLLLHLLSALLVYLIAKRISGSRLAGAIAVIIFSLSPLGLYFQRRILLDNIMIFWALLSVWLLLINKQRLRYVILSAVTFGLAVVTKENAIFFLPAYLYLLYRLSHVKHKKHAITIWLIAFMSVVSMYVLYALLKGELFIASGTSKHVSLLGALEQQNGRGAFHFPWQKDSQFYTNANEWLNRDPFIIIGGFIALAGSVIVSVFKRRFNVIAAMSILMLLFLIRGKLVIDFYILPLLPLFSVLIGTCFAYIAGFIKSKSLRHIYGLLVIFGIVLMYSLFPNKQYSVNETSNQLKAIQWIKDNISSSESIAIDDYMYPALQDQDDYNNADWFFKIQLDPSINAKYKDNYKNIHYLVLSNQIVQAFRYNETPIIEDMYKHSVLVADFTKDSSSYNDLEEYISTNGDWAQVYKLKSNKDILLQDSWEKYKSTFIKSYGQIVDKGVTTSEGQAYAMLRSVRENDRDTFDGVYSWTKDHMQHRPGDKLFSWKWQQINGKWQQVDSNTATDADQDIAYALLQAYSTWNDKQYLSDAKQIISDIWNKEVIEANGLYYLMPSAAGKLGNGDTLYNPSYISPSYYKMFAQIDAQHPWSQLTGDSYRLLNSIQNKSTGLFPNWIEFDQNGNQVPISVPGLSNASGYDAFRTGYRLSQDGPDPRAQSLLTPLSNFYVSEWKSRKMISAVYSAGGTPQVPYGDLAQYGAMLNILKVTNQSKIAQDIYTKQIEAKYKDSSWGDPTNYYNQNWVWLGISTYGEDLKIK